MKAIDDFFTIPVLWTLIVLIFAVLLFFAIRNIISSAKWWTASKKFINEEMKQGDVVYVSNPIANGRLGRVTNIHTDTVDVTITVRKSDIYLPNDDTFTHPLKPN